MSIFVDQVGYPAGGRKLAVCNCACNFQIIRLSDRKCVFDGVAVKKGFDPSAGEETWQIDFSDLTEVGSFYILSGKGDTSPVFTIGSHVYDALQKDLMKAFYFQRCGCALEEKYAGVYTHKPCHTAPAILYEDYAAHKEYPQTFDMTGGWHDAGDFGRYTTAGAVAVSHLLYAYELFPESFREPLNIPESGNGIPDILNECLYELKWMMKMQFPDGSVSHKLTAFCHADFIMPEDDHDQFLIYPVSSMAAADFAAVMALASRVYEPFLPEFSAKALKMAKLSFEWLLANPYIGFHNPEGSNTGEYDDVCDMDERMWAAAELLRSDKSLGTVYLAELEKYVFSDINKTDFGWTDVSGFALLAVLTDPVHTAGDKIENELKRALFEEADKLLSVMAESGYSLAMKPEDFCWGSNMVVCNRSMLFILAALLTEGERKTRYSNASLEQLHYLLGRNALNISYVTGHGEHAFRNPHNRPTFADGIELPMPGWISGGPFKTPCDPKALELIPEGTPPMKCYVDEVESYSTNEITIYWNSPAVFMTAYFATL